MALEIIPLEINGKVINKVVEDETTVFTFLFYNKDGINITPARTVYTDEEEQIPELSTQIAYGVYIEPYYKDGEYIFTFEYLNNVYKGIVNESDYENLTANSVLEFYNSTADGRLLPEVTVSDNGKVLRVVSGEWNKADGDVFVCTFTKSGNTISCNKTAAEIDAAYKAGKAVIGIADYSWGDSVSVYGTAIMNLTQVDYNNNQVVGVQFTSVMHTSGDNIPEFGNLFYLKGAVLLGSLRWNAGIYRNTKIIDLSIESQDILGIVLLEFVGEAITHAGQYTRTIYEGSISELNTILSEYPAKRVIVSMSEIFNFASEVVTAFAENATIKIVLPSYLVGDTTEISVTMDMTINSTYIYCQGFADFVSQGE